MGLRPLRGPKLAEPFRALHVALMRETATRADRGELLDRVHHCDPFLDRYCIELGFCFGVDTTVHTPVR